VQYVQPFGIDDPDAPYINGDPSIARQGSIPPAAAFEHPMRELVSVIADSMITPDSSDLEQVAKGVRSQRMNYCEDTGSVNTLSVALDPPLGGYTFGLPLRVKVHNTNTGPATIDAGAGRVPIRKPNGTDLAAGDLPAFGLAELVYDGTVFQMINFGGAGSGTVTINQTIPYCVDSSVTRNLVTANFTPPITSLVAGTIFMVKIANTSNGSSANINVNGLGNKAIFAQGCNANWPLLPGDIQAGDVLVFTYDGTRFWVYANPTINEAVTLNASTIDQLRDLFSALGRKRISTSGSLTILLATGIYQGTVTGFYGATVLQTYHADADRITVEGTMKAGQVPPDSFASFQHTGNDAASRANDSGYNITMLRARYGTEFRVSGVTNGIMHFGPGRINFKNILVTGSNAAIAGQACFAARGSMKCEGCSVWGAGDVAYAAYGPAQLWSQNSHVCAGAGRGFAGTGNSEMILIGGSSQGNASHGVEISNGARGSSHAIDRASQAQGFHSTYNGGCGVSAQSGFFFAVYATIGANGNTDFFAWNMGTVARLYSTIYNTSPAYGTEGNLNSIAINYG
jgi:hypothetical protein